MRVALLQYPIEWADPQANVGLLNERLYAIAGKADIAVVPEMFSTGFCTDRPDLAEPWGGRTCQALQEMADRYETAIMGSMMVNVAPSLSQGDGETEGERRKTEGGLRNRGFLFRPHGEVQYIDKHHLYKHGGEADFFEPGQQREVWEYMGVKIRLAICYDLRFPVWLRQDKRNMYDLLVFVGCWPTVRIQYWDCLLPARAAENHCYVVGVNMVGTDGLQLDYNGHSVAYDTRLEELAQFGEYEAGTRIVEFSMEKLRHFREVLPQWEEGDEFRIVDR